MQTFAFLHGLYRLLYNLQHHIFIATVFQRGNHKSTLKQAALRKSYDKQNSDMYNRPVDYKMLSWASWHRTHKKQETSFAGDRWTDVPFIHVQEQAVNDSLKY